MSSTEWVCVVWTVIVLDSTVIQLCLWSIRSLGYISDRLQHSSTQIPHFALLDIALEKQSLLSTIPLSALLLTVLEHSSCHSITCNSSRLHKHRQIRWMQILRSSITQSCVRILSVKRHNFAAHLTFKAEVRPQGPSWCRLNLEVIVAPWLLLLTWNKYWVYILEKKPITCVKTSEGRL